MTKVKVGVARNTATGKWHIIGVSAQDPRAAHVHDDLVFETKAQALAELERQIKQLGPPYTIEWIQ